MYDTRTGHKMMGKPTERHESLLRQRARMKWLCGFAKVHGIGARGFRMRKNLRVRTVWLAPGKCVYRYPIADDESKGVFSLLSGRWHHDYVVSKTDSVVVEKNATTVADCEDVFVYRRARL